MWKLDEQEPLLIKKELKNPLFYLVFGAFVVWGYLFYSATLAFLGASILAFVLILHTLIDFKTFILPDRLTYPGILLGLILPPFFMNHTWLETGLGFILGYGFFWLISVVYEKLRGYPGMGFGDVKLLGMLGAWCGAGALPIIILMASLSGIVFMVFRSLFTSTKTSEPMPFGPFLCLAGWLCLLYPAQIWNAIFTGREMLMGVFGL